MVHFSQLLAMPPFKLRFELVVNPVIDYKATMALHQGYPKPKQSQPRTGLGVTSDHIIDKECLFYDQICQNYCDLWCLCHSGISIL